MQDLLEERNWQQFEAIANQEEKNPTVAEIIFQTIIVMMMFWVLPYIAFLVTE